MAISVLIYFLNIIRYGIPRSNKLPSKISLKNGTSIFGISVSNFPIGKFNLPLGGGAYLWIYPIYFFLKLYKLLEKRGENLCIYLHPWELDSNHPKVNLPFRTSLTHYFKLNTTIKKLGILLKYLISIQSKKLFLTN